MGAPRVLHVGRVGFLGGVERVMVTLAGARAATGAATAIVAPGQGALEALARARGIAFHPAAIERSPIAASARAAAYPLLWARAARAIGAVCAAFEPDILHAHHPIAALQAAPSAHRRGIPILLHLHEIGPAKPLYRAALMAAMRASARVICVSQAGLDLARSAHAPKRVGASVLHNGVDPDFERAADAMVPAPLGSGGPRIGVFGVLEPRKGQDVALEATARLRARWPEAQLWLVGPAALADKAAYVARLTARAQAPDLAGAVRLAGYREDVAALMKAMDVVVLPSVAHESLSMVLLEALTLGRPVVATRVGGAAEAVIQGSTGLLVAPGDPALLAGAIARLLGPEGPAMGVRARADARARFSSDRFAQRIEAVYAQTEALAVRRFHESSARP